MKILIRTGVVLFDESLCHSLGKLLPNALCHSCPGGEIIPELERLRPELFVTRPFDDRAPENPSLLQLHAGYPDLKILLLVDDEYDHQVKTRNLLDGVEGYLHVDSSFETLCTAIKTVHEGQIWAERSVVNEILQKAVHSKTGRGRRAGNKPEALNQRQKEILALVANGLRNKEIAGKLCISEKTVKSHLGVIYSKLGVTSRLQAALKFGATVGQ